MKQKKVLTRKQLALRRLIQFFSVLVIVALYSGANLFPRQAVNDIADQLDMKGNKEFIECFYDGTLPVGRSALQYLVDGEQAMMLCTVGFSPLMGWYDRDWCKVETWDEAPLHVGLRSHNQGDLSTHYLFGRIDNGYITDLVLYFDQVVYNEDGTYSGEYRSAVTVPEDAIFRADNGQRYILTSLALPSADGSDSFPLVQDLRLLAYDREGKVIADEEVYWQSWGSS